MDTKLDAFYEQLNLNDSELAHFGVRGQKWGVRRSASALAKSTGDADSTDAARARTTQAAIKSKGSTSTASDADLQHLVSRINLEKKYTEATAAASSSTVHSKIKTVLDAGVTMNRALDFARSPAGYLLGSKLGFVKSKGRHTPAVIAALKKTAEKK